MSDHIVHAVMYRNYEIGTICDSRAWGPATMFSLVTDDVTCPACRAKLDGGAAVEAAETPRPRVRIVVTHITHQTSFFPVPPEQGWKVDAAMRCIVIGRGLTRTHVPLDGVLWFELEEITQ